MTAPDDVAALKRELRELEQERDQLRDERVDILESWVMALVHTLIRSGVASGPELQQNMLTELENSRAHDEAFRGLRELFREQGETDEPR